MQIASLLLQYWNILADCWKHLKIVQMFTMIVEKPMKIFEKLDIFEILIVYWKDMIDC